MFVKTQFDTVVNLAYYSKIYIDYSVQINWRFIF